MKTKIKWIGIMLLVAAGVLSCANFKYKDAKLLDVKYVAPTEVSPDEIYEGIVRLHDKEEKDGFFCSAFVVTNEYAITAAHCIVGRTGSLSNKIINVKDMKQEYQVEARAAGMNPRQDYGIIRGDFSKFKKFLFEYDKVSVNPEGNYLACGFPMGQFKLVCSQIYVKATDYFAIQGIGMLYPGMSGGPVIDMTTGYVVGTNSHVNPTTVAFSPLIGILATFDIEPERK